MRFRIPRLADGLDVQLHKGYEKSHDTREEGIQSQTLHPLTAALCVSGHRDESLLAEIESHGT